MNVYIVQATRLIFLESIKHVLVAVGIISSINCSISAGRYLVRTLNAMTFHTSRSIQGVDP